jgi:hypothetical protein
LNISDILIVRTDVEDIDIGFDTFLLNDKCELDPKQWAEEVGPKWQWGLIGGSAFCLVGYVFFEGIVAIWHKIF